MDRRFVAAWAQLQERRAAEGASALRRSPTRDLVAALAGSDGADGVATNAVATELLNRARRAPFLGAFLASVGFFAAVFLADTVLVDAPSSLVSSGIVTEALAIIAAGSALVSVSLYALWRGAFPRVHAWASRNHRL